MNLHGQTEARCRFDFGPVARKYDRWYATPAGMAHELTQKTDVLRFLARTTTKARLLDVGCGTGQWSSFFATLGYAVVAVDLSPEMVSVARSQRPAGTAFQVADASALPFKDGSFAIAAAMATLEFVLNPSDVLREMARCIRQGGRILVGTLNRLASLNRQRVSEGREPYASGLLYSPDELRELLRPFGRIRMVASDPENAFTGQNNEYADNLAKARLNGPFIVAEVQT